MDYLEDELILANCLGENPEWKERKERRFSQEDNKGGFFISCNDLICTVHVYSGEGGLLLQLFLPTVYEGGWRVRKR